MNVSLKLIERINIKGILLTLLTMMLSISLLACSSNNSTDVIEAQAKDFAIKLGDEHYKQRVENTNYYLSSDEPEVVNVEVIEDKYFDIRCKCECVLSTPSSSAEVQTIYYDLRLEYKGNNSFDIVSQQWGGV